MTLIRGLLPFEGLRTFQGVGDVTDDRELWAAAQQGDGNAFAQLWDRHRDRAFRSAMRVAGTTTDAEDVVASAFLELWRRREHVRLVDGSVLPWLLVTVFNLGRNVRRGLRRHSAFLATLPPPDDVPDHAESVLDRVAALREERSLARILQTLPAMDRDILVLVALEGMTLADAGAALGIRVGAAKTRLARARRRARSSWHSNLDPFTDVLPEGNPS